MYGLNFYYKSKSSTCALLVASAKFILLISHPPNTTSQGLTVGKTSLNGTKISYVPVVPILITLD